MPWLWTFRQKRMHSICLGQSIVFFTSEAKVFGWTTTYFCLPFPLIPLRFWVKQCFVKPTTAFSSTGWSHTCAFPSSPGSWERHSHWDVVQDRGPGQGGRCGQKGEHGYHSSHEDLRSNGCQETHWRQKQQASFGVLFHHQDGKDFGAGDIFLFGSCVHAVVFLPQHSGSRFHPDVFGWGSYQPFGFTGQASRSVHSLWQEASAPDLGVCHACRSMAPHRWQGEDCCQGLEGWWGKLLLGEVGVVQAPASWSSLAGNGLAIQPVGVRCASYDPKSHGFLRVMPEHLGLFLWQRKQQSFCPACSMASQCRCFPDHFRNFGLRLCSRWDREAVAQEPPEHRWCSGAQGVKVWHGWNGGLFLQDFRVIILLRLTSRKLRW